MDAELRGLALLARRWGTSPDQLRHQLTDAQFRAYLGVEADSQSNEWMVQAMGTAAAIAQTLGGKQTKALRQFHQAITSRGTAASAKDSSEMSRLRGRIKSVMGVGK